MVNAGKFKLKKETKLALKNGQLTGKQTVQKEYVGKFTPQQVINFVQKTSNDAKKMGFNGQISSAWKFASTPHSRSGWMVATSFSDVGDKVKLFDIYDGKQELPEYFHDFTIYLYKTKPTAGGCGNFNDCLFKVLQSFYKTRKLPWISASNFKKFLSVHRMDPIDISKIPAVEEKLKIRINVTGDHVYLSTKSKRLLELNINLCGGHYFLDLDKKEQVHQIAYVEKHPIIYEPDGLIFQTYDGSKYGQLTKEKFKLYTGKECQSGPYTFFPAMRVNDKQELTIEEQYARFIKEADAIKIETNGLINLYKTGCAPNTAYKLFYDTTAGILCDPIGQVEAQWLNESATSALIFCEKGYKGYAHKYDIKSSYGHVMIHTEFPMRKGEFKIITQVDLDALPFVKYGIYRCEIEKSKDPMITKIMRWNSKNKYTHLTVDFARGLGLKVTMIEDGKHNLLDYPPETRMSGKTIFGEFVRIVFELKEKGYFIAKQILISLWGKLCEGDTLQLNFPNESETSFVIRPDQYMASPLCPLDENNTHTNIDLGLYSKPFKTNYARIKPFILAKGRMNIINIMKPYLDKVIRCHTDSMITLEDVDVKTGTELGDLKDEGVCMDYEIINNINFTGKFQPSS